MFRIDDVEAFNCPQLRDIELSHSSLSHHFFIGTLETSPDTQCKASEATEKACTEGSSAVRTSTPFSTSWSPLWLHRALQSANFLHCSVLQSRGQPESSPSVSEIHDLPP